MANLGWKCRAQSHGKTLARVFCNEFLGLYESGRQASRPTPMNRFSRLSEPLCGARRLRFDLPRS
jgi:hypothetical protein